MRCAFVLLFGIALCACGADEPPHPLVQAHATKVAPVLLAQCADCHTGEEAEAGFDITPLLAHASANPEAVLEHAESWERVAWMVAQGAMPPEGSAPLSVEQRSAVSQWVPAAIAHAEDTLPRVVGALTIRRLNRTEYAATVKDLLGVVVDTAAHLPPDDAGMGFDHLGEVLTLSPTHLEAYLAVASEIAQRAVVATSPEHPIRRNFIGETLHGAGRGRRYRDGWMFSSRGHVRAHTEIPRGGVYRISVRAWGQQAGPDVARMHIRVLESEQPARIVDVPAVRGVAEDYTVEIPIPAGLARIEAAFVNDYYNPTHKDPKQRDRNLAIERVRIEGPLARDLEPLPAPTQKLLQLAEGNRTDAGLLHIARDLVPRAWRRPVDDDELAPLVALAEQARSRRGFGAGVQRLIEATLVSSMFLFRIEEGIVEPGAPDRALTPHELACRLSYFLWGTMPDATLRAHADADTLHAAVDAQVARLLADPRADALVDRFAFQWLSLPRLEHMTPDTKRYPTYTPALRASMLDETRRLLRDVFRSNGDIRSLLYAPYTWLNESLAAHYGLDEAYQNAAADRKAGTSKDPSPWRRIEFPNDQRGGLLGHASILTVTSYPTRTSPVQRGHYVLDTLLGRAPPPAPPGVASLDEDETEKPIEQARTVRARLEQHRADPTCAVCHATMDVLGYGLEPYDAIGRWRTQDLGRPIDATGTLPDGQTFNGPAALRALLSQDPSFDRVFAERLLTYALGRGLTRRDGPTVRTILDYANAHGRTLKAFVHAIIASRPFLRLASPESDV